MLYNKIQAHTDREEVRQAALEILRRRDGRIRITVPRPIEAHKMVAKHFGVEWNTYLRERRAAYYDHADAETVERVAEREAVVEFVRAIPRYVQFITGRDVTMPVMFSLAMSADAVRWTWEVAEAVCAEQGLKPRGLERWLRALYGA
jgi:hypothetical protein